MIKSDTIYFYVVVFCGGKPYFFLLYYIHFFTVRFMWKERCSINCRNLITVVIHLWVLKMWQKKHPFIYNAYEIQNMNSFLSLYLMVKFLHFFLFESVHKIDIIPNFIVFLNFILFYFIWVLGRTNSGGESIHLWKIHSL